MIEDTSTLTRLFDALKYGYDYYLFKAIDANMIAANIDGARLCLPRGPST